MLTTTADAYWGLTVCQVLFWALPVTTLVNSGMVAPQARSLGIVGGRKCRLPAAEAWKVLDSGARPSLSCSPQKRPRPLKRGSCPVSRRPVTSI